MRMNDLNDVEPLTYKNRFKEVCIEFSLVTLFKYESSLQI